CNSLARPAPIGRWSPNCRGVAMADTKAIWIKDPLGILAEDAERGVVVRHGKIVELVAAGATPKTVDATAFDAGQHVVLPGLINTHHHFYQTLTRAGPAGMDRAR